MDTKKVVVAKELPLRKSDRIWSFSSPYFPAFGLVRNFTLYISVFSPNVWKYGPEELQIREHFSRDVFDCFRPYFGVDYTYQSSFVSYGKLIESS